jgi:diguanylate cyclase (GGDEF)-like protein
VLAGLRSKIADVISPENARQRRSAEREASTDALTGVANQRAWQQARGVETAPNSGIFKGGVDESPNRAVVHMDLDNFKPLNEEHPRKYDRGDEALVDIAKQAVRIAREVDPTSQVFRTGGDEFTVATADGKEAEVAKALSERVRHKVGAGFEDVVVSAGHGKTYSEANAAMGKNKIAGKAARTAAKLSVDAGAHEAATSPKNDRPEPTQPQIEAGNFKKGHVRVAGLDISVESPKGAMRSGTDASGKPWSVKLKSHYGYVKQTTGADKEHVDVFVKPKTKPDYSGPVFVVNQNKGNGHFDEHKIMLGWPDETAAREGYLANYDKSGPSRIRSITRFESPKELKTWLDSGNLTRPAETKAPTTNRRQLYDRLAASRRTEPRAPASTEPDDYTALFQSSGLTTVETDRVRAKYEDLKKRGESVDDYLRQGGLFGSELSEPQQQLLRELDAAKGRRAPTAKQESLFEKAPTLESKREQQGQREFRPPSGSLFQADTKEGQRIINDVVDDLHKEGVRDFREAARKFREEFGPADDYAEMFEKAWDAHAGVKKRGRLTFERAMEEPAARGKRAVEDMTLSQYVRREGGLNPNEYDEVRELLGQKQSGTSGLMDENQKTKVHELKAQAEQEGFIQEGMTDHEFIQAVADDAAGRRVSSHPGKQERNVDAEWEAAAREEFANNSDHSVMSAAFDNPNDPAYKDWVEAFDGIREAGTDDAIQFFKEASGEIGLGSEAINRLIASASEYRETQNDRAQRAEGGRSGLQKDQASVRPNQLDRSTPSTPTDRNSFKQALINRWDYDEEVAHRTAEVMEGFAQSYVFDQKLADPKLDTAKAKKDFYRSLLVAGPGESAGARMDQLAHAATEFTRTGTAVIRALEEPNESSGIHELKHGVTPLFFRLASQPNAPTALKAAMATTEQWMGLEPGEFLKLHQKWVDGTATDAESVRYRKAQERDARGFERYLREGKAPTQALKDAFAKFAEWLSRIYRQIKGSAIDIDITDQMRRVWDRMLGSEREKAEALVNENEHWNFKRSTFASPETETAFREIVRKATVEAGAAHKEVVTREAHLERVGELHPDLIKQVGALRTSQIASREIFTAASQYAQTLTRQAQDLRAKITDSTPPLERLSAEDKIAALEHDATEIMAHTIGVRSEFGRNLALLATQKTDQLSPEKVLAFGSRLAEQAGLDRKGSAWQAKQLKLVGLSNELQSAKDEKKRIAGEEKKIRDGSAKPKKQGWQTAMMNGLKSQAQEASERLQAQFGKKLYQEGRDSLLRQDAELPTAAHDIATILAARVAEESSKKGGLPLGRLIEDMRNSFPDVINQFEEPIKAAADAMLKDARRKALVDAARDPEQRMSARQELAREISDAKRALREAEKALETKTRQMEKAWEADAEKAATEAMRAYDRANAEFEKSLKGTTDQASAADRLAEEQAQRAFARSQRDALAKEAREQVRAAKDAETERLRTIADDAREQLKQVRRATAEALTYRRRWDFPIQEAARSARERISDTSYSATVADLAAIGAEKNLDPNMTPQRWHREMGAFGEAYSKNATKIRDAVAELRANARADFNRRKLEERTAGAQTGAKNIAEREQAREDYQSWAARRLEELAAEREWQERREREAKRDLAKEFAKLEKVPLWERALDIAGLPISLASSIDLPHLRQGLPTLMNHPKVWAESLLKSVSTWTEAQMEKRLDELENHPLAELIRASGLKQSGLEARRNPLSSLAREEQFQNRLARLFPHVRVSERQYTTAMDIMRAHVFALHARPLLADLPPALHPEVYQDIARIVNIMTGVGDLGSFTKYAPLLNRFVLYATRYLVSRFQMLGMLRSPAFYRGQPWSVRRIAAKEAYGYVGKLAALLGLAAAFGLTSLNPDDEDFGKIHIPGTGQRWDVTGGMGSFVRTLFKLSRSAVRKIQRRPEFEGEGAWDTLLQFGRSKLAPVAGTIVDAGTGKTFTGEPLEWDKKAVSLVAPMISGDVYDAVKRDGARGLIMVPFALLGGNVSTYPSKKMPDRTGSEAERYATGMLREKMGDTPETPAEYKRRMAIGELVIAEKSHKPTDRILKEIEQAGGPLTDDERGKVKGRVAETPLQHAYRNLGEDEKQRVLDVATEAEKKQIEPKYQTMTERIRALIESDAFKQMTPAEQVKARKEILSRTRTEDPDLRKTTNIAVLEQEVRTAKGRVMLELMRNPIYEELTETQQQHVKDVVGQPFDGLKAREVRGRLATVSVRARLSIARELQKARSYHRQAQAR